MVNKSKQKGFTIIELVVVILLLGILTATALPRFMDVTDEAHATVVTGLQTGLSTSTALFSAQWYAEGQPLATAVKGYGGTLFANAAGFVNGTSDDFEADATPAVCLTIYQEFLQAPGRPLAVAGAYDLDEEDLVEAATLANS